MITNCHRRNFCGLYRMMTNVADKVIFARGEFQTINILLASFCGINHHQRDHQFKFEVSHFLKRVKV